MSRKAAIKVLALVVDICVITASVFVVQKLMKRTTSFSRLGSSAQTIHPVFTIQLPETKDSDGSFTCTGLSHDTVENVFWGGTTERQTQRM